MRTELASEHGYYLVAVRSVAADTAADTPADAGSLHAGSLHAASADAALTDAASADAATSPPSAPRASVDGYAGLLASRGAAEAEIQTIAVAPHARRHGIGRALIAALIAEASERGARDVFLEVRADNPGAQTLYHSFGFEQIGVRSHYYQPDGVDALVMKLSVGAASPAAGRVASPPTGPRRGERL
ncbi:MAG: ribosomal-protein-alanine N-acetyltransferase [Microbacteriaceae bacterium]|nr:MAG: ribosomal-protein-alanine N-acetyltransferase [Microbacteriaceae bacterium]